MPVWTAFPTCWCSAGGRGAKAGTVSVRHRDKGDLGAMPFEQFADLVAREIAERHISPVI